MPDRPLIIKLLGTSIVDWQDQSIAISRRQTRALLYRLAAAMQPVSRDERLLLLWPDTDEAISRRSLTRLLSALRSELPHPDTIQATPSAVSLNPALAWSDSAAFGTLAGGKDSAQWETAVALVRGPFLDGFSLPDSAEFDLWQSRQRHAFERRYLVLLADMVRVKRQRGQLQAAIDYARQYLATDDLAEEMHRHLIELYAETGDRGAAMRQFEECVAVLEQELGVPPLPETRAAYEAARDRVQLANAESLPEPEWAVLPTLALPLLGRKEALSALDEAYDRLQTGGAILISGEAGVGKTRLMQAFAMSRVALVLTGSSNDETTDLPYQPLVQALRQALPLLSRWRQMPPIWLAEVARLLPELRALFPDLPAALEVEPEQAQARLFEALRQAFSGLAPDSRLLLCLDDVHWADRATRGWLHYMTRRLPGSRICILAIYRSANAAALLEWQRGLQRTNQMAELALGGLAERAVGELLCQLPQRPPQWQPLAARIHMATAGNAFFVLETIRELMSGGRLAEAPARLPLPQTVREAVLRRAGRLTALAQQVLEVTSVLAPNATFETIAEAAGRDELETAVSLEELAVQQLLRPDGDQFQFRHELAREAIYKTISPWRRQLLHRRAAGALQKWTDTSDELAAIAFHFEAAGDVLQAIESYHHAAKAAAELYAYQAAVDHLERCLLLARQTPGAAGLVPQLLEELGDNLINLGRFAGAETIFRELWDTIPETDVLSLAKLADKLATTLTPQHRSSEAEQICRQALARLDGAATQDDPLFSSVKLNLLLTLMTALYYQSLPEPILDLQDETETLLAAIGTIEQQITYKRLAILAATLQNQWRLSADRIPWVREALALAYQTGNKQLIGQQASQVGIHLIWLGELAEAEENLQKALMITGEIGDSWQHIISLVYLSILYRLIGDTGRVKYCLTILTPEALEAGNPMYIGAAHAQRSWLHYKDGEWSQARAAAQEARSTWAKSPYPLQWLVNWVWLALALRDGQLSAAVDAGRALLSPKQQKMPDDIVVQLQEALSAADRNDAGGIQEVLKKAVDLATQHGYL